MMALVIIGMLALFAFAAILIVAGLQLSVFSMLWTGKMEPLGLIPLIFGGLLIWLACHLSPWTITLTVAS